MFLGPACSVMHSPIHVPGCVRVSPCWPSTSQARAEPRSVGRTTGATCVPSEAPDASHRDGGGRRSLSLWNAKSPESAHPGHLVAGARVRETIPPALPGGRRARLQPDGSFEATRVDAHSAGAPRASRRAPCRSTPAPPLRSLSNTASRRAERRSVKAPREECALPGRAFRGASRRLDDRCPRRHESS